MTTLSARLLVGLAAILMAGACASSRNLDASFSDLSTNAELKRVLFADRNHEYGDVDLTIYEGRLMLTGTMQTEEGRDKLVENAWKAPGVKQVIDEVQIAGKTGMGQGLEDTRIDQVLRARLIADGDIKSGDYKIAVSQGVVYLLGAARSEDQLNQALQHARSIGGVEKVVTYVDAPKPAP